MKCPNCDSDCDETACPNCDYVDPAADYNVTCARCGRAGLASQFIIEEADEWKCVPCFERY